MEVDADCVEGCCDDGDVEQREEETETETSGVLVTRLRGWMRMEMEM